MGRDYAGRQGKGRGQRSQPQRRKQTQQADRGLPGWLWMLIGITVGLVIAVGVYVAKDGGDQNTAVTPAPSLPDQPDATPAPRAELPPKQEARFTFYEMLPNTRLVPRSDDYTPPEEPAAREDIAYAIQAGSFAERDDADARRAEVALLGMESRIEPVDLEDGRSVYRVIIGPDNDFGRVKDRMARLYAAGIESFFRRVDAS